MSEITKLSENAGIEKCNRNLKPCPFDKQCDGCEFNWYPPFTAKKQLELIKWLVCKFSFFDIELDSQQYSSSNGFIAGFYQNSLEESIADFINALWQDLTPEEKAEIKEILK